MSEKLFTELKTEDWSTKPGLSVRKLTMEDVVIRENVGQHIRYVSRSIGLNPELVEEYKAVTRERWELYVTEQYDVRRGKNFETRAEKKLQELRENFPDEELLRRLQVKLDNAVELRNRNVEYEIESRLAGVKTEWLDSEIEKTSLDLAAEHLVELGLYNAQKERCTELRETLSKMYDRLDELEASLNTRRAERLRTGLKEDPKFGDFTIGEQTIENGVKQWREYHSQKGLRRL